MFVHLQQVIEVIVCAAGKAVDLVAFRIVAHGGVVVEMLRVQATKALAGINAPFPVSSMGRRESKVSVIAAPFYWFIER